jgi:hypothetical protein
LIGVAVEPQHPNIHLGSIDHEWVQVLDLKDIRAVKLLNVLREHNGCNGEGSNPGAGQIDRMA